MPIGPDQVRFVRHHEVNQFRKGFQGNKILSLVARLFIQYVKRMEPFIQGVVDSYTQWPAGGEQVDLLHNLFKTPRV